MITAYCAFCRNPLDTIHQAAVLSAERVRERRDKRYASADVRDLWKAIGFLAARATISIVDRDEDGAAECEDEYQIATGETIHVPVNPTKWGHSITFEFEATNYELAIIGLPPSLLELATRNGTTHRLLSSTALGWALFTLGFRVGAQDVDRVLANVPPEHLDVVTLGALCGMER
jgi:hypothetical protein